MPAVYSNKKHTCSKCGETKLQTPENYRSCEELRSGKPYDYVKRICRECEHTARLEYGRINRERQNSRRRSSTTYEMYRKDNLKKFYGITIEEYQRLFDLQGGKCAICKLTETQKNAAGAIKTLSVDHDHATGKIRGLLCGHCNRGLGYFRDNTTVLESAIRYLKDNSDE